MTVKEAIKELRDSWELHQCEWAKRCLDVIEEKIEKQQAEIEKLKKKVGKENE